MRTIIKANPKWSEDGERDSVKDYQEVDAEFPVFHHEINTTSKTTSRSHFITTRQPELFRPATDLLIRSLLTIPQVTSHPAVTPP